MKFYSRMMLLLLFLVPLIVGCANQPMAPVLNPMADFDLTATEKASLITKADQHHDGDAAFRLSFYYLYDRKRNSYWLTKAARYGNASAQYNLAYNLAENGTVDDFPKAQYWLNRAKKSAVAANNRSLLEHIRYVQADLRKRQQDQ